MMEIAQATGKATMIVIMMMRMVVMRPILNLMTQICHGLGS